MPHDLGVAQARRRARSDDLLEKGRNRSARWSADLPSDTPSSGSNAGVRASARFRDPHRGRPGGEATGSLRGLPPSGACSSSQVSIPGGPGGDSGVDCPTRGGRDAGGGRGRLAGLRDRVHLARSRRAGQTGATGPHRVVRGSSRPRRSSSEGSQGRVGPPSGTRQPLGRGPADQGSLAGEVDPDGVEPVDLRAQSRRSAERRPPQHRGDRRRPSTSTRPKPTRRRRPSSGRGRRMPSSRV